MPVPEITQRQVLGFQTTGAASDYFAVSADKLVKQPDDMGFNEGAMIGHFSALITISLL